MQRWTYTEAGQVETVTDPLGAVTRHEYAGVDLVKTIDPLGNETSYRYDEQHRLTATTDALGNKTVFVYDDADNLTSVTFADGTSFAYEYDAVGNLVAETDAEGNTTRYEYDGMRQRVKTVYPDGSESESRYDNSGNMIAATDAAGGKAEASYDGRGRLTATTDELGNQTAYEYDLNGNLVAQTLATGDVIRYTYDVRGRLLSMEAAGESIRYEYDAAGNVTRTVVGEIETRRKYDSMSRIVYELDENGENAQYRYDLAGNAVWISNSYGETVNEFDANGNLVKVKDAKTGAVKFRYERDALGNKTAVYLADGSMIRYDYDELGAYLGYEFVEPGRQPHGTVPGANYKPSRLVPPAEETKNWKKTDALKEADKQIRHAKFAEYTTEVAYVEAEAMAPGSAQAKSAKAAYAQTKKAVDAANAAKDAVADAKTQTGINRAVTSAQIAAGTAGRAADMVCLWEGSVASAKQAQQAKATQGMTMDSPEVEWNSALAAACSENKKVVRIGNYLVYQGEVYEIPSGIPIANWDEAAVKKHAIPMNKLALLEMRSAMNIKKHPDVIAAENLEKHISQTDRGEISYNGEHYKIYVPPAFSYFENESDGWKTREVYSNPSDVNFDWNSAIPFLNFTDFNGERVHAGDIIVSDRVTNPSSLKQAGTAAFAVLLVDIVNQSTYCTRVDLVLQENETGESRAIVLLADSRNDITYENVVGKSSYSGSYGAPYTQAVIDSNARKLYRELTGDIPIWYATYDIQTTTDSRHSDGYGFYLWYDEETQTAMAYPVLYPNDSVEVGKQGWLWTLEDEVNVPINVESIAYPEFNYLFEGELRK